MQDEKERSIGHREVIANFGLRIANLEIYRIQPFD